MPLRFAHAGNFHLDEDRYFTDTAQCLEWFVTDAIRPSVDLFVINGDLTTYKATMRNSVPGRNSRRPEAANAKEYVRRLRGAMDLGGFHQVSFICHTPLVCGLADRALEVHGGQFWAAGRWADLSSV